MLMISVHGIYPVTEVFFYETPHMDALASEGVKFTRAYSAYPRCLPARQALLSGKYPSRITYNSIRKDSLKKRSPHALPLDEVTFGEVSVTEGKIKVKL